MSQYKPYPELVPSGHEWLGQLPAHWSAVALGKLATARCDGPFGSGLKSEHYSDSGVRVVRLQNIGEGEFRDADAAHISVDYWRDELGCGHDVAPNDLLVAGLGDDNNPLGRACVAPSKLGPALVKADCYRFRLGDRVLPRFAALALSATARHECGFLANGATRDRLNLGLAASRRVPLPPVAEQRQILDSVDQALARINALITRKTRFIELLKEKRQALITHAVTKGVDPTVRMKDSGVEWMGKVPAHWEILPSTWLFAESKERAQDNDIQLSATQKYGVIPQAEFERLEARQVTHAVVHLEQRKHVEIDNFVISMRSFEGGIERVKARGCVRSSYVVLIAQPRANVGYFSYVLKANNFIQGLQSTASFIRDGQDLSFSNFRQLKLPAPSVAEQEVIAAYLENAIARMDMLTSKTSRSVALLKERRAALITAAVTGQIDLRADA